MANPFRSDWWRRNVCRFLIDVLIIGLVGLPSLIMLVRAQPYERGFYCDDQTLMHPYLKESVPVGIVAAFVIIIPLIIVYLTETCRMVRRCRLSSLVFLSCRKYLIPYFFGCCITQLVTDIGKYCVGRLRPHFLTVCQPMVPNCSIETGFLYGDGVCKGLDIPAIIEARLSFPSGHSSMSFYSVIWLMIYLQYRFTWLKFWLVRPVLQGALFVIAYLVALSRISDYFHHWSDVFAGSILGFVVSFTIYYLCTDNQTKASPALPTHRDPSSTYLPRSMPNSDNQEASDRLEVTAIN